MVALVTCSVPPEPDGYMSMGSGRARRDSGVTKVSSNSAAGSLPNLRGLILALLELKRENL